MFAGKICSYLQPPDGCFGSVADIRQSPILSPAAGPSPLQPSKVTAAAAALTAPALQALHFCFTGRFNQRRRGRPDRALDQGIKNFVGGNCTVSLMMLAIQGLLQDDLINWISVMSYQAVSGAGAKAMIELVKQTSLAGNVGIKDSLKLERDIHAKVNSSNSDFWIL